MLQKRRLGRTGNDSSLAIMGAAAFSKLTQAEVDKAIELCISHGVNHIDVAPSYGDAEKLIGPWLEKHRKEVFLGCKTEKRGETEAHDSLHRSLERLRIERFDLLQLHAVTSMPDLDKAMDGALKALVKAREEGLTKWIGITGHGIESPAIYLEALRRFDFDTVMFPVNPVIWSYPDYRRNAEELLAVAETRDIGIMAIKAAGRRAWEGERRYSTWYEPWDDAEHIRQGVHFALSQRAVAGVCTVGEVRLLPMFLDAVESYTPMNTAEQERLVSANVETAPAFKWLL
jgi:aryl-alcohol dehydrogenase-like predicted oxidoreductase